MKSLSLQRTLSSIAIVLIAGCGGNSAPRVQLIPVKGIVTLDNKPLPKASIAFHPLTEGNSSFGRTDENGEYVLLYQGELKGAVTGQHRIEIRTKEEIVKDGQLVSEQRELLPARYHDQSKLTADVDAVHQQINFELKSK